MDTFTIYVSDVEVDGPITYRFNDGHESSAWNSDVHALKNLAASINAKHPDRNAPSLFVSFQGWLRVYNKFVNRWCLSHVPPDVLRAKVDIVEALLRKGYKIPKRETKQNQQ